MKPVAHPTNTREIGAPADHDQSILNIQALPITDAMMGGIPALVSYWRPDAEELATLNAGAPLRLWIVGGHSMPPVWIDMDGVPAQPDGMLYSRRIHNRASTTAAAKVIRDSLSEIAAEADREIAGLRAEVERLNLLVMQGADGRAEAARAEEAYRAAETLLTADDRQHRADARRQAIEEAAAVCEGMHEEDRPGDYAWAVRQLNKA